jgi:hypothetical protein
VNYWSISSNHVDGYGACHPHNSSFFLATATLLALHTPRASCSLHRPTPNHAQNCTRRVPCVVLHHYSPLPVQCRTATVVFPTLFFAKPLPSPPCATPPCPLIIDFVLHTSMCAQGHRVRACTRPPRSRMQGRTLTHESLAVGR